MIGRPGAGIVQMNGQPTAQNNRECGADGDLPGFRNWDNAAHVQELATLWNVDPATIPHWAPPTDVMARNLGDLSVSSAHPARTTGPISVWVGTRSSREVTGPVIRDGPQGPGTCS